MEETVLGRENGTVTEEIQERTFTQEEVNNIVTNRLKKESAKYTDYEELKAKASKFDEMEEANKSELQRATEKADALQKQLDAMNKANEISLNDSPQNGASFNFQGRYFLILRGDCRDQHGAKENEKT